MLTLYIWNNDSKSQLIMGPGRFGHAALLVPGDKQNKAIYISWWPQTDNRVYVSPTGVGFIDKLVSAYTVTAVRDRGFGDDVWGEHSSMLANQLVGTLSNKVFKLLEELDTPLLSKGARKRILGSISETIKTATNGSVQLGRYLIGEHEHSGWVLLEDVEKNVGYVLIESSRLQKVKLLKLTDRTTLGAGTVSAKYIREMLNTPNDAFARQKLGIVSTDILGKDIFKGDTPVVISLSEALWQINGKWKSYLLRYDAEKSQLSIHECRRSQMAPDQLIQIPTKSKDSPWGLDENAIRTWWTFVNRADSPQWSTLDQNCAVVVMSALKMGGAASYHQPPNKVFLCWTPGDVVNYVKTLNERIKTCGMLIRSRRIQKRLKERDPLTSNLPQDVDFATSTVVLTKEAFVSTSSSLALGGKRSQELSQVDAALAAYHALPKRKDAKLFTDRAVALGKVMDAIAELMLKMRNLKLSDTGNATILQLADKVYAERQELLRLAVEAKKALSGSLNITATVTTTGVTTTNPTGRIRRRLAQLPARLITEGSGSGT